MADNIYDILDKNSKEDKNLTVDFYFDDDVSKQEAVKDIAKLVRLADNQENILFNSYKIKFWSVNPDRHWEEE